MAVSPVSDDDGSDECCVCDDDEVDAIRYRQLREAKELYFNRQLREAKEVHFNRQLREAKEIIRR